MKTCFRASVHSQDNAGVASGHVLKWPSQSPEFEHLWGDLKIAVQQCSLCNLTALEKICREERLKLPKYRCAELVAFVFALSLWGFVCIMVRGIYLNTF